MSAPTLFDMEPSPLPVRSSDPATSCASARRLNLKARKAEVLHAAAAFDGSFTADQLLPALRETRPDYERGWVASRLSQLARDELVESRGVGEGTQGRWVTTWVVTDAGRDWLRGQS